MSRFSEKAKLIAAAVFGGVVVISGAATAATGSLPLVSHGQSHSHPTPKAPDAGDDQSDDTGDDTGTTTPDTNTNDNHGSEVSGVAKDHSGDATAGNHGKVVCATASDGKCLTKGKSSDSHGQNDAATHGKAHQNTNTNHGQSTLPHGKNDTSGSTHGKSSLEHGKASLPHGKSGQ